jgi:fibro-slime domain-containing protein
MKRSEILMGMLGLALLGCEDNPRALGNDLDGDGMPDDSAIGNRDPDNLTTDCDTVLEMTIRDFDVSHPDFEREHSGWGPVAGIVAYDIGDDPKPVFVQTVGDYKLEQGEDYTLTVNNWTDSANPMFDGADSFYDWYRDSERNERFEKTLTLKELPGNVGVYYFESSEEPFGNFFPLAPKEGFGPGPEDLGVNPNKQNFLFTTEIHLRFGYVQGQVFKFSGDDDLWIFVNGKLALDMGGLHVRFNGSIDFDAQAAELGITPGQSFQMDIFHAERHTQESNFRIETNISCFEPVIVVK